MKNKTDKQIIDELIKDNCKSYSESHKLIYLNEGETIKLEPTKVFSTEIIIQNRDNEIEISFYGYIQGMVIRSQKILFMFENGGLTRIKSDIKPKSFMKLCDDKASCMFIGTPLNHTIYGLLSDLNHIHLLKKFEMFNFTI